MAGSFQDAIKSAGKSAVCQALKASEQFGNSVVYAYQSITGINATPPNFASIAAGLFCGNPASVPPVGSGDFTGGQCNCVAYSVSASLVIVDKNADDTPRTTTIPTTVEVWGEVLSVNSRLFPAGENNTQVQLIVRSRGNRNLVSCGAFQDVPAATTGAFKLESANVSSVSVSRIGGGSEACDTLPPPPVIYDPLPPTGLPPISIPFTFSPDVSLPDVTVNVNATAILFQPKIDIDANIVVPITIQTNINVGGVNLEFNAVANLSTGDVNFNFGGGDTDTFDPAAGCCDDFPDFEDEPPVYPPSAPPEPAPPDPNKPKIIVGVLVTTTSTANGKFTTIVQSSNPTIYAPALGFVNFFCEVGIEKTGGWTADIPVKNVRQIIPCPWEEGAVSVQGTPNTGNSWILTPIFRQIRGVQ